MTETPLRRAQPTAGISAPADKRFRRSASRPARRQKWQFWAIRAGILSAAAAVSAVLLWIAGQGVMGASVFQIDHLKVEGQARLTAEEVRAVLDGLTGQSIFRADLEEYRGRLIDTPWIEDAVLWRVLPSSIHVQVTERVPLAVARRNGQFYLVDRTGAVIDDAGPEHGELDLPIVDGLFPDGGTQAESGRIAVLDRLLAEVATRADLRDRLSQVDLSDARNAVVLLDDEPARLRLGNTNFVDRLQRYLEARGAAEARFAAVDYYDLRFDERIFVGPARATGADRH